MLYMSPCTLLAGIDSVGVHHTTRCEVLALRDSAYSQFWTDVPASDILTHISDVEDRFKVVRWRWRNLWYKIDRKWRVTVLEQCAMLYAKVYDDGLFDRALEEIKGFRLSEINVVKEAHDFVDNHRIAFDTTGAERAAPLAVSTITHFQETHAVFCRYAAATTQMYNRGDYDATIVKEESDKLEALLGAMIAEALNTETEESVRAIDLACP